jgi:hypothetical protein
MNFRTFPLKFGEFRTLWLKWGKHGELDYNSFENVVNLRQ